jgi:hypothetical protein
LLLLLLPAGRCSEEEYLGCLRKNTSNVCFIEDSLDEVAGTLDMGLATVREGGGREEGGGSDCVKEGGSQSVCV